MSASEHAVEQMEELMEEHDVASQSEMAEILGVSRALVNGILKGRNEVTMEQALRMDSAFEEFDVQEYFERKARELATDLEEDLTEVEERAKERGIRD